AHGQPEPLGPPHRLSL
ncbi:hypothetical protein BMAFMH_E0416, partial [Burkholderia mallei FMH]